VPSAPTRRARYALVPTSPVSGVLIDRGLPEVVRNVSLYRWLEEPSSDKPRFDGFRFLMLPTRSSIHWKRSLLLPCRFYAVPLNDQETRPSKKSILAQRDRRPSKGEYFDGTPVAYIDTTRDTKLVLIYALS